MMWQTTPQWHFLPACQPQHWPKPATDCSELHRPLWLQRGVRQRAHASVFIWIRPWTMWLRARWWWPRQDSCWTSSWGRTSSTSLGSRACTSWRSNFGLSWSLHFQECLFPFGVAYALQKDSPYTERYHWAVICHKLSPMQCQRFSSKIQQLKESGLINLWIQQEQDLVAQRAEEGFDTWKHLWNFWIQFSTTNANQF